MSLETPILQLCPRLSSGGIERGTVDVSLALKKAGYRPIVISGGGLLEEELHQADIEHITLPIYKKLPWDIKSSCHQLTKLIEAKQPSLIHARSRAPIWAAYYACQRTGTPLITSCHSPHSGGFFNLKHLYNKAVTFGDEVIATSAFIKAYLIHTLRAPQEKIHVIHRGIDLDKLTPENITDADLTAAIERYQLPKNKRYICMAGRITRWKGQDVLLKAITQLKNSNLHAIIVGRIDSEAFYESLKTYIDKHHIQNQITFIPESTELPLLYRLSDIALSTSRKPEAFGRIAVESQAMGCLTIATNLGAAKETVIHNKTGWLVEPDDPQALANAINMALSLDEKGRLAVINAARQHVAKQFDQRQMLAKTLAVYAPYINSHDNSTHDTPY